MDKTTHLDFGTEISPIFLHVTNLQRRAGRLFETARLRQTKSSYYYYM